MSDARPFLYNGQWHHRQSTFRVLNPWSGQIVADVCRPSAEDVLAAAEVICGPIAAQFSQLPTYRRAEILFHTAEGIRRRQDELVNSIIAEAGKPRQFATGEVSRAIQTFTFAADTLRTTRSETLPLDLRAGLEGRVGIVRRFPVGPVLGISPFNFPLNLVAHKIAPSIMAGNPILLKPASATPITALKLGEILLEAGMPPEGLAILPASSRDLQPLTEGDDFRLISFTGSDKVGWGLKRAAGKKKVILELGGDAASLIAPDADLDHAAKRNALGAYAYAGQVCISVQRLIVHAEVYEAFREKFLAELADVITGDPNNSETVCGPMIDTGSFNEAKNWLDDARQMGATVFGGATQDEHNLLHPSVLEDLPNEHPLHIHEAFAPIAILHKVSDMETAMKLTNQSRYGLQAGLFTQDHRVVKDAWNRLEVGGIVVNDVPMLRVDHMPYGGVKDSGLGREGLQYAYEEMTEPRLLFW